MKTQDVCKQKERVSQWGAGGEKDCRYKREKGCFMGLGAEDIWKSHHGEGVKGILGSKWPQVSERMGNRRGGGNRAQRQHRREEKTGKNGARAIQCLCWEKGALSTDPSGDVPVGWRVIGATLEGTEWHSYRITFLFRSIPTAHVLWLPSNLAWF